MNVELKRIAFEQIRKTLAITCLRVSYRWGALCAIQEYSCNLLNTASFLVIAPNCPSSSSNVSARLMCGGKTPSPAHYQSHYSKNKLKNSRLHEANTNRLSRPARNPVGLPLRCRGIHVPGRSFKAATTGQSCIFKLLETSCLHDRTG